MRWNCASQRWPYKLKKKPRYTVTPTGAGRRFFLFFAPAKKSAREVEGSLLVAFKRDKKYGELFFIATS
jgi:hypothetical protein